MSSPSSSSIQVTRDGKTVSIPLEQNQFFSTNALRKELGVRPFDAGLVNTAVVHSAICSIDGEKGELRYRGYRVETLVERCSFLEVAFLLIHGELPTREQLEEWQSLCMGYTFIHEDVKSICSQFRHDAHPMGFLVSACSALGTFYPEANPALRGRDLYKKGDPKLINQQIYRVLGKLPTLAAAAYRHRMGREYNSPATGADAEKLGYSGNFLQMLDRLSETDYTPHPRIVEALEKLFIIHAEHGLNASTAALRHVSSCGTDLWSCIASACAALYGPSHGGANQAVITMLREDVKTVEGVPAFLERVKRQEVKLMGFGHRVYKSPDPRARLVREIAEDVFEVCGRDKLIDVAEALAKAALEDEYFSSRKLYPNVDYYSGLIYFAIGFPVDFFPVMFALGRVAGWLAHWKESISDPEEKIYRPGQVYTGAPPRPFVAMSKRPIVTPKGAPSLQPLSTSGGRVKRRRLLSKL